MTNDHIAQLPITATQGAHSCACCSTTQAHETADISAGIVSATYDVAGMTCDHCVRSVTEELTAIPEVTSVEVALEPDGASAVTVHSDAPVARAVVSAAISEAGYRLVEA